MVREGEGSWVARRHQRNSSDFLLLVERKKRREAGKARDRFNFRNHVQCKLICWVHFRTACSFYFKPIWQGNCWRTVTNLKAFPSVQSPPRCVLISQQVVRSHPRETNVQSYCNSSRPDTQLPQCVSPQLLWLTPQAGHNVPHSKFLLQDNIIITTSLSDQNIGDAATLNSHHFTDKTEILYTILHLRQRYYRYV